MARLEVCNQIFRSVIVLKHRSPSNNCDLSLSTSLSVIDLFQHRHQTFVGYLKGDKELMQSQAGIEITLCSPMAPPMVMACWRCLHVWGTCYDQLAPVPSRYASPLLFDQNVYSNKIITQFSPSPLSP